MEITALDYQYIESVYDIEKTVFPDAYSLMSLKQMCDNNLYKFSLVIKYDKVVVGYILATEVLGEAEILRISVCNNQRRRGYASMLLKYFMNLLKDNFVNKIFLEVRQSNFSAISLYEKFGFVNIDVRKKYYSDNGEDALIYVYETDKAVIDC